MSMSVSSDDTRYTVRLIDPEPVVDPVVNPRPPTPPPDDPQEPCGICTVLTDQRAGCCRAVIHFFCFQASLLTTPSCPFCRAAHRPIANFIDWSVDVDTFIGQIAVQYGVGLQDIAIDAWRAHSNHPAAAEFRRAQMANALDPLAPAAEIEDAVPGAAAHHPFNILRTRQLPRNVDTMVEPFIDVPYSIPPVVLRRLQNDGVRVYHRGIERVALPFRRLCLQTLASELPPAPSKPFCYGHAGYSLVANNHTFLSPDDTVANIHHPLDDACMHVFEDCSCNPAYSYGYTVDRLFHMKPDEVRAAVTSTRSRIFYAFTEMPDAPDGTWHRGEINYSACPEGSYAITIPSLRSTYNTVSLDWLHHPSYHFSDGFTLENRVIASFQHMYLIAFTPGLPRPAPAHVVISFTTAMTSSDHYGESGFVEPSAIVTEHSLWARQIVQSFDYRSAGPFVWLRKRQDHYPICVPKELINTLATEIAGKPRNQDTFTSLLNNSRQHVRSSGIPSKYKPLAVTLCASVAFSLNTNEEADIIETNTNLRHFDYERLNANLKLPRWIHIPRGFIAYLFLALTIYYFASIYTPINTAFFIPALSFIFTIPVLTPLTILFAAIYFMPNHVRAYDSPYTYIQDDYFVTYCVIVFVIIYYLRRRRAQCPVKFKTWCAGPMPDINYPQPAEPYFILGVNTTTPLPHRTRPANYRPPSVLLAEHQLRPTLMAFGITSPLCNPYSYCSNWHNEKAFLCMRILREVPVPMPGAHQLLAAHIDTHFNSIFPNRPEGPDLASANTRAKWLCRFPLSVQNLLILAYEQYVEGNPVNWFAVYQHSAFVKREKSHKDGKPRGIQAAHPLLNALNGPDVHRFSQQMAACWNSDHYITYSPGMNSVQHGQWLVDRQPLNMQAQPEDFALYDTTMLNLNQEIVLYIMWRFFMNPATLARLKKNYATYGKTHSGARYVGDPNVKSGDTTTTTGNTVFGGVVKSYTITEVSGRTPAQLNVTPALQRYSTIIAGDDSLTLFRANENKLTPHFERSLGLQPEYEPVCLPEQAVFLSAVFMPVSVNSKASFILSPLPGRILSRFGFGLIPPNPQQYLNYIRGNALGLRDVHNVPILGPFLQAHLRLTAGLAAKHNDKHFINHDVQDEIKTNMETLRWFCARYEIALDEIVSFSQLMSTIDSLPFQIPYHHIRPYYERDVGARPVAIDNHDYRNDRWSDQL
jgi:hypothetical protein